jgi:hypothetical protein
MRSVDLHRNLFYSYRGPNTDIADRDRQLENNVTKALINTLDLGGSSVCGPFLAWLGLADTPNVKFLLQRYNLPTATAADKRDRVLLGISKKELDWVDPGINGTAESVPDAWVYGDNFAVLVESKIDDAAFSQRQMKAHLARLQSTGHKPPKIVLKTWGQIHGFFEHLLPRLTDVPSAKLLVEQFIEFLEYSGMTEFTGFRLEHFRYFLLRDDDEARRWIRDQVGYFANRVQAGLYESTPFYEASDIGNLKLTDAYCWAAFGPRGNAYRKVTHQTISLASDGLRVFVNSELKAATDRLKSVLKQSNAAFRAALQHLHAYEPFELVLEERTQRQASIYDYTPKMRLHSSMLDVTAGDVAWAAFTQTVEWLPLPYLRIERLVPAQKLIELSRCDPPQVVQHIVEMLLRNHAMVRLLNE